MQSDQHDQATVKSLEGEKHLRAIRESAALGPYRPSPTMLEQIERTFTYHAPKGDQVGRYGMLRDTAHTLALRIAHNCPPSRETSLALTKLEEAVMFANAAIARHE